jgi:N-dimethylarginine dimethylaminohydrolase
MALIEGNIPSSNIIRMPSGCYAEGGDVIVHNHYVFIGVSNEEAFQTHKTSRTNYPGLNYLSDEFPEKTFKGFELLKSDVDPRKGSLHLDCAFQPVGCGALLAPHLFKNQDDVDWIKSFFGTENVYECSEEEAYALTTNVFSVSPTQVIVADTFISLVDWLTLKGMEVFKVPYSEIVKMGGLLRCSTMPLKRD